MKGGHGQLFQSGGYIYLAEELFIISVQAKIKLKINTILERVIIYYRYSEENFQCKRHGKLKHT